MADDGPRTEFRLQDGRAAPPLLIMFQCPDCHVAEVRNAYLGVALCPCRVPKPIMHPERIVARADVAFIPGRRGEPT